MRRSGLQYSALTATLPRGPLRSVAILNMISIDEISPGIYS
jgi:hypothetical protein